jgi:MFS family permease
MSDSVPAAPPNKHTAFFGALFFARLADQILLFLVPLVVYQLTQSVAWSGIAFFVETLPRYLFFPFLGALCDRVSPLKLMRVSRVIRSVVCLGGIAGFWLFGGIGWVIVLSALCGVLTSQEIVAREVILPQLFPGHRFEKVLSYSQLADQLGMVMGPVLAAILMGWLGWQSVIVITAALFFGADLAMNWWQRTSPVRLAPPELATGSWTAPIRIALRHVLVLPGLKKLVALAFAENLVIGVTLATSAAMVTGLHGQTDHYYAALQSAGAVTTIAILIGIARTAVARETLGLFSFVAICLGGIIAALSPGHWGYAIGFLLIVGFDKMFNVYIRSSRQKIIPPKDLGKTSGVVILLNNISQPIAGLLIGLWSGHAQAGSIILALSLGMGAMGALIALASAVMGTRMRANKGLD